MPKRTLLLLAALVTTGHGAQAGTPDEWAPVPVDDGADEFGDDGKTSNEDQNSVGSTSNGAILVNAAGMLFGTLNAELAVGVAEDVSLNLGGWRWHDDVQGLETTSLGAYAGTQIFFAGDRFRGAFVYPMIEVATVRLSFLGERGSGSLMGPAALVGYQWDWRPFTIRLAGGGRYLLGEVVVGDTSTSLQGLAFKGDASVGLSWW